LSTSVFAIDYADMNETQRIDQNTSFPESIVQVGFGGYVSGIGDISIDTGNATSNPSKKNLNSYYHAFGHYKISNNSKISIDIGNRKKESSSTVYGLQNYKFENFSGGIDYSYAILNLEYVEFEVGAGANYNTVNSSFGSLYSFSSDQISPSAKMKLQFNLYTKAFLYASYDISSYDYSYSLNSSGSYLNNKFNDLNGYSSTFKAGIEIYLFKNFGFGFAYDKNIQNLNVSFDNSKEIDITNDMSGVNAYLAFRF